MLVAQLGSWRSKISGQGDWFPPVEKGVGRGRVGNARRKEGQKDGRERRLAGCHKAVKITTFLLRLSSFQNDIIYSGTLLVEVQALRYICWKTPFTQNHTLLKNKHP